MKLPRQLLASSSLIKFAAHSGDLPASGACGFNRTRAVSPALELLQVRRAVAQTGPVSRGASLAEHFSTVERLQPRPVLATSVGTFLRGGADDSAGLDSANFAKRIVPHTWCWPICPRLYMHYPQTDEKWVSAVDKLKLKDFSTDEMRQWVTDFNSFTRSSSAFDAAEFNHYYAYLMEGNVADPEQRANYLRLREAFCDAIAAGPIGATLKTRRNETRAAS